MIKKIAALLVACSLFGASTGYAYYDDEDERHDQTVNIVAAAAVVFTGICLIAALHNHDRYPEPRGYGRPGAHERYDGRGGYDGYRRYPHHRPGPPRR